MGLQTLSFSPKYSPVPDLDYGTESLVHEKYWNDTLWMSLGCWNGCTSMASGSVQSSSGINNSPVFHQSCGKMNGFHSSMSEVRRTDESHSASCLPLQRHPCLENSPRLVAFEHQPYPYTKVKKPESNIFETIQEHSCGFNPSINHVRDSVVLQEHLTERYISQKDTFPGL